MRLLLVALSLGLLAGCQAVTGSTTDNTVPQVQACEASFTAHLAMGIAESGRPRFDWTPGCGVTSIVVESSPGPGAAPVIYWGAQANDTSIHPPVVYGAVPEGATGSGSGAEITAGTKFRVAIYRAQGDMALLLADTTFTR